MKDTERAQVALILNHERLAIQRTCQEKLQAMYAHHSAHGRLQSGATAREGIRIIEELAERFVAISVQEVEVVVKDEAAFGLIVSETESLFRVFKGEIHSLSKVVTRNQVEAERNFGIVDAIQKLFTEVHGRIMRQLEIRRFSFAEDAATETTDSRKTPETITKQMEQADGARATAGRLPADWWDDLWLEIFRQIYLGDLKPKSQADIVRAMQQWLSDQDIETGDSTLKPRARKLFFMLQNLDA